MGWLSIAILSSSIFGVVNVIDSHLISRRMPSLGCFLLPVAIVQLIYGSIIFALFPFPGDLSASQLGLAIGSGLLRSAAATIMLHTMTTEEISRVIPVVSTYPLFVSIMAVPLLGESLSWLQWVAVAIVVAGAVLVSLKQNPTNPGLRLGRSFRLLMMSSLLTAGANITSKYALSYISFWNMYSLTAFCIAFLFLLLSARPSVYGKLKAMPRRNSAIILLVCNELGALAAIVLSFWAIKHGPVSLVSTAIGSRPAFVFLYSLILTRIRPTFLKWHPSPLMLILRLVATAMIVGGIAIIYLAQG